MILVIAEIVEILSTPVAVAAFGGFMAIIGGIISHVFTKGREAEASRRETARRLRSDAASVYWEALVTIEHVGVAVREAHRERGGPISIDDLGNVKIAKAATGIMLFGSHDIVDQYWAVLRKIVDSGGAIEGAPAQTWIGLHSELVRMMQHDLELISPSKQ